VDVTRLGITGVDDPVKGHPTCNAPGFWLSILALWSWPATRRAGQVPRSGSRSGSSASARLRGRGGPSHSPDLDNELSHGVVGGDGISEHRGVHDTPWLAGEHAGGTDPLGHELPKKPWSVRDSDAPSRVNQHRGVQARVLDVEATSQFPAQVGGTCSVASVPESPSKTLSTMTVSTRGAGMEGQPFVERYRGEGAVQGRALGDALRGPQTPSLA